ncbi:unnamed protein product, partial [Allacma fusca]
MISIRLYYFISAAFFIASYTFTLPYSYNAKTNTLRAQKKNIREYLSYVRFLSYIFYTFYITATLGHNLSQVVLDLSDLSIHAYRCLVWMNGACFYWNHLRQNEDIAWLFNQLSKINYEFGVNRKKSSFVEQIMMSWLPSQ